MATAQCLYAQDGTALSQPRHEDFALVYPVAAGSGGEGGHAPRAALCMGGILEGRKYGVLKFGRFWRIGV